MCGEVLTSRSVAAKILRSLAPKFDHVVVAIEESQYLLTVTKEKLQRTLEPHERIMVERPASKSKGDVALHAQSIKDKNAKGSWNGDKGRGGYNNLNGRSHQQERNSSNQRRPSNQGNHIGGVAGRGKDGGRKPDKIHIQHFNFEKYGYYTSVYPENKINNQENDARIVRHEEEEMLLMVTMKEDEICKDQWYLDSGCSSNMTERKDWVVNISPSMKNKVRFTNDNTLVVEGDQKNSKCTIFPLQ